jgi:pyruvate/2-oxoglutarate dehydrogenase complex dihydrolipoamide acyltransferase (E2) component
MSTELRLPKLGMSMTEGSLTEWLVAEGAPVEAGAFIYALETDKTVQEIEAPVSGVLRILEPAGETYEVGHLVGVID